MSEPRGCYEPVNGGTCRNKFYRTIGATPGKHAERERMFPASPSPYNRRCWKHWSKWQNTLMSALFGEDWAEWIGDGDYDE